MPINRGKDKTVPKSNWDNMISMFNGSRGSGKSYTSMQNVFDAGFFNNIKKTSSTRRRKQRSPFDLNENGSIDTTAGTPITTNDITSHTVQNTGDGYAYQTNPYDRYPPTPMPQPFTPTPMEYGTSTSYGWYDGSNRLTPPGQKPSVTPPVQKHDPEELKGKLVAYATVRVNGAEHTGILFVRKCGAWKLIECRTMQKVASATKGAPMPDVTIHYIIFSEVEDVKSKKKSRFEDIDIELDENPDNG